MPIIKIHNVETGEVIEREMNAEELRNLEKDEADSLARQEIENQKNSARQTLLQRLGITEEEAKLLLS